MRSGISSRSTICALRVRVVRMSSTVSVTAPDSDAAHALLGIDFTSAPSARKPIVVAHGRLQGKRVLLERFEALPSLAAFEALLARPGPWLGAFDLPFGLPREFVDHMGWPCDWPACIRTYAAHPRAALRAAFKAFCAMRPVGSKFAHRATDVPAGSSPSMKWVNPPVAWMLHAGAIRLLEAGVTLPGLFCGDPSRIALEAYPGMIARRFAQASYKSDVRAGQTPARRAARAAILGALCTGAAAVPCVAADVPANLHEEILADGMGDRLDATICLAQAGWALQRAAVRYGLPERIDPLEGWIVGAEHAAG